jgi:NAD(P)-dependent dehydrogenase (short-subunit alcohol dehydrogenase family)
MENRFAGKTVVIAGAAGGQGRAGAILFAREGANLALCDVNDAGLAAASTCARWRRSASSSRPQQSALR